MRIALLSPGYPPDSGGGIGAFTATMARALARAGHETLVVTWVRGPEEYSSDGGATVLRLERRPRRRITTSRLLATIRIQAAVRDFRPDVIEAPEYLADAWSLSRSGLRERLVTRLATPTYLLELLNEGRLRSQTRVLRWLEQDQARRSAAIIAPTQAIRERVGLDWRLDPARIHVIPNPVDADDVQRAGRAEPPVELPRRFLAFVARAEPRKGAEVLADSLRTALAGAPDVHAVFVGGGTPAAFERLRRLAGPVGDRVHFLDHLSRDAALAVVARAELVVLPSLWENFSNSALEALALGRPLIATHVGGFPEFIEENRTGWLVPPGDALLLGAAIAARLADPAGAREVGAQAAASMTQLAPDLIAQSLLTVFEQVRARTRRVAH
jgi:glycogen(starch) synthase